MIYQGIEPEVEGCSPWCVALWYMHMYSGVGTIYLGSGWLVLVFLNAGHGVAIFEYTFHSSDMVVYSKGNALFLGVIS